MRQIAWLPCRTFGCRPRRTGAEALYESVRSPGCGAAARRPLIRRRRPADRLSGHLRDRVLPHAQRHDAVASAGDLSEPEEDLRSRFRPYRAGHPHLPGDLVAAAAARRPLHRQARRAVRAADRDDRDVPGTPAAGVREFLCAASGRCGDGRHRLVGVPSGEFARGAYGGGAAARFRAIHVPVGRQHRHGARRAGRGLHRRRRRAARHRLVLRDGGDRDPRAVPRRPLVQASWPGAREEGERRAGERGAAAGCGCARARHPRRADLLEVRLSREPVELLHVLSHREIPSVGAECAAASVPVPGRRRGGNGDGRAARRPLRAQAAHLVLDPGRAAVHARAALRQSVLDQRAQRVRGTDACERVSRHRRLRSGAGAGESRRGQRLVLRAFVRHGRTGRGCARMARRS